MSRSRLALVGLVAAGVVPGCAAPAPSPAERSSSSSAAVSNRQVVMDAVARERRSAADVQNVVEASVDDEQSSASTTLTGPYDFARRQGRFSITVAAAGTVRTLQVRILPKTLYVSGDGVPGGAWAAFARDGVKSDSVLRPPANDPAVLLDWAAGLTHVSFETAGSVNGVPTQHFQGVIPLSTLYATASAKVRTLYRQLDTELGDDSRRMDVYIDRQGRLRRLYWAISTSGGDLKTQTEFAPRTARVAVPEPDHVVDGSQLGRGVIPQVA